MELFSLQTFLFFSFLFLFYFYFHTSYKKPTRNGFKHYPILGFIPDWITNRHRFLDWTTEVLKSCPSHTASLYRPVNVRAVVTANPSNIEHILKTNFENYPKGETFISYLEDFLGRGIFNADGELWKLERKISSYEFNTKSLRNFITEIVTDETFSRLVPILRKTSESKQVLDLQDILERFAFDNICKLAFNVDPGCLDKDGTAHSEFMRAFAYGSTNSADRFLSVSESIWKIKRFFNIGSERVMRKSIAVVHEFANNIIRSRMETKAENMGKDLLSRLMRNNENSPEFLRDIVISFILAGRDTTSTALTWFFWLLSSHSNVEEKILKELESIRTRNGKSIGDIYSFEELGDMNYLHAALSEAMRLYPPIPTDTKECMKNDILPDGTFIGEGWLITYISYAMGRMESIWGENCHEYLPERWLENGIYRPENMFRFPIFHAGPRICLGKEMAYIQMKSVAASVIERFVIDVQDKDRCPEQLLSLSLKMKNGLLVRVKERCVDVMK